MQQTISYSTILFDFDGTLTPSLHLWAGAFQFALEKFGVNLGFEDVIRICFYREWKDIADEFELPATDFALLVHSGLEQGFQNAEPFPGVDVVLDRCCRQNIKLGIVTSSRRAIVQDFMERNNISGYFESIVTAEDIQNHKPHPEPIFKALSRLNSSVESSFLIGDSAADMLAANAAGVSKALFFPEEHHKFYNFDELISHQPQFTFGNYRELAKKLSLADCKDSSTPQTLTIPSIDTPRL